MGKGREIGEWEGRGKGGSWKGIARWLLGGSSITDLHDYSIVTISIPHGASENDLWIGLL